MSSTKDTIIQNILQGAGFSSAIDIVLFIINILGALAAITGIVLLAVNIVQWSGSADNPVRREMAKHNIMCCLICLAVLGGLGTIYALILSFVVN